jgi:hypothetical protein
VDSNALATPEEWARFALWASQLDEDYPELGYLGDHGEVFPDGSVQQLADEVRRAIDQSPNDPPADVLNTAGRLLTALQDAPPGAVGLAVTDAQPGLVSEPTEHVEKFAGSEWVAWTLLRGPRKGQKGWKNTKSGKVVVGERPGEKKKEEPKAAPQPAEKKAAAKAPKASVGEIHGHLMDLLSKPDQITPQVVQATAEKLKSLTVAQLTELKKKFEGVKASGKKDDLATKIAERVLAKPAAKPEPKAKAKPEAKPAAKPPIDAAVASIQKLFGDIDKGTVDEQRMEQVLQPVSKLTIPALHQVLDRLDIAEKPKVKGQILDRIRRVVRHQMESRARSNLGGPSPKKIPPAEADPKEKPAEEKKPTEEPQRKSASGRNVSQAKAPLQEQLQTPAGAKRMADAIQKAGLYVTHIAHPRDKFIDAHMIRTEMERHFPGVTVPEIHEILLGLNKHPSGNVEFHSINEVHAMSPEEQESAPLLRGGLNYKHGNLMYVRDWNKLAGEIEDVAKNLGKSKKG